jgi:hypothetical protein
MKNLILTTLFILVSSVALISQVWKVEKTILQDTTVWALTNNQGSMYTPEYIKLHAQNCEEQPKVFQFAEMCINSNVEASFVLRQDTIFVVATKVKPIYSTHNRRVWKRR